MERNNLERGIYIKEFDSVFFVGRKDIYIGISLRLKLLKETYLHTLYKCYKIFGY